MPGTRTRKETFATADGWTNVSVEAERQLRLQKTNMVSCALMEDATNFYLVSLIRVAS